MISQPILASVTFSEVLLLPLLRIMFYNTATIADTILEWIAFSNITNIYFNTFINFGDGYSHQKINKTYKHLSNRLVKLLVNEKNYTLSAC